MRAFSRAAPRAAGRVQDSPELRRILSLPRRVWMRDRALEAARALTDALRAPGGEMSLRPIQAVALIEMAARGGLLAPIRVGGGKTLISLLAARMFPDVARPLLLLPAHLREKTQREEREMRSHWVLPPFLRVESYQTLSRINAARLLEDYQPDLIVADEAHYLKNPSAACTKRVSRYIKEHRDRCVFVGMSGTILKRSLHDFAHLSNWALRDGSPAPADYEVLDEWCRALDWSVGDARKLLPGALSALLGDDPTEPIRVAYRRRLVETPGVVATQDDPLPIELVVRGHLIDSPDVEAFRRLRDAWETPDGWQCADGIEVWRHARELGVGCYYVWDPRPPRDWLHARSEWASVCRQILTTNRRHLDTELQVKEAVRDGFYPHAESALRAWDAIEPSFEPVVRVVWRSSHGLDWIDRWARESPGIVWVSHTAVGRALAERGWPYYGSMGVDAATGRQIEDHDPMREGSIAASVSANATGRNLQAWSRNLIVGVPPDGTRWEQLLGRTHRDRQRSPRVTVDVYLGCYEDVAGFWRAAEDAAGQEEITGQAQKLVHADIEDVPDILSLRDSPQWAKAF